SDCYQGYWTVDGVFGGGNLHRFLLRRAVEAGVEVRCASPVSALVRSGETVTGVTLASGATIRARGGVVIATGGFAGSPERVSAHLGIPDASPWGSPHCTGDGLQMAVEVGAGTSHVGRHSRLLGTAVPG
ncbi:MAG TPA: FAD-dependent oxidoreductase, partial [Ilumatobacteraceae bacterium]|nr:FAD-dependent oxidoreductase [Ilumatobacteraceae bacterium]